MIKQFLRISFFTILFVSLVIIVRAEEFNADLRESFEYRTTAQAISFTQRSHELRAERKEEDRMQGVTLKRDRLGQRLHERTKRENYEYAGIIRNVKSIVPGITTPEQVIEWFGLPDEVFDGASIVPLEYTARYSRLRPHLFLDEYPLPTADQYIFARSFYFTEMRSPFVGNKLHVLVTVNQKTCVVENYACYNEDGVILSYWLNNLIS